MADFIGLSIRCTLHNGTVLLGTVRSISPSTGIQLGSVTVHAPGLPERQQGEYTVPAEQVKQLEVISLERAEPTRASTSALPPLPVLRQMPTAQQLAETDKVPGLLQLNAADTNGKRKPRVKAGPKVVAPAAPSRPVLDDFDYITSTSTWNKGASFAEISANDLTDPATRLVAHNRLEKKLGIKESVLSAQELLDQERERESIIRKGREEREEMEEEGTADEEPVPVVERKPVPRITSHSIVRASSLGPASGNGTPVNQEGGQLVTTEGVPVSDMTAKQLLEVLSIADLESCPPASLQSSLASFALTSLLLHHLLPQSTKAEALWPTSSPRVSLMIFAGDLAKTQIAIESGILLLNKGWELGLLMLLEPTIAAGPAKEGLRRFSAAGGRIVRDVEDLRDDYELIVDCLAPSIPVGKTSPPSSAVLSAARWANNTGLRILSLSTPYGIDSDTGLVLPGAGEPLDPFYVVALGGVLTGLKGEGKMGGRDSFLLDLGLPEGLWRRVGVQQRDDVFATGFWTGVRLVK